MAFFDTIFWISPVLMLILDKFIYFGYNYSIKVGARLGRTISCAHGGLSKIGSGRGPKINFLAIGGRGGLKWLVQVEQIVVHIGTQVGGLLWTQNSSKKFLSEIFLKTDNLIKSKIGLDYEDYEDHNSLIMCSGEQSSSE